MRVDCPIQFEMYFIECETWVSYMTVPEPYRGMGKYTGKRVYDSENDVIYFIFEISYKDELVEILTKEGDIYTHGI